MNIKIKYGLNLLYWLVTIICMFSFVNWDMIKKTPELHIPVWIAFYFIGFIWFVWILYKSPVD